MTERWWVGGDVAVAKVRRWYSGVDVAVTTERWCVGMAVNRDVVVTWP